LNVKFVCKDPGSLSRGTLFANKAVLATGSKILHQLLSDTGDEDVTIFVPGSDFNTIKMLLQYIYTGQVLVDGILDELQSWILDWVIYKSQHFFVMFKTSFLYFMSRMLFIQKSPLSILLQQNRNPHH